ncbi:MAG: DUF420 domain-containing protein [Candidatus Omnitrophica bacterium]|nr:DUF420 domain-containing protein [Candidatus Omnitrophota bacterium]MCB9722099.1 DUF420 domain-containing protein [Candidatus Omnitrophota bacterium]
MDIPVFPTINATLNFLAGIFLWWGYTAIKKGDQLTHKKAMIAALTASGLFLISYLTYHYLHGSIKYTGEGFLRIVYFTILLTHTPLAALMVPFILAAVYFALKGDFARHVKITRWLFPVWMYVSVTGVVIYLMLYVF